jgi:pimeloyl-ACP methyl ester carboxylesterase
MARRAAQGGARAMGETALPFRIEVSDAVLEDLRERLARTRFPDQLEGAGWSYGTELSYLKELCEYWRKKFDWRAQEALLNRFDHFRTDIEGRATHFIHARSPHEGALPLVITHGWPGSVFEFYKIIGPLSDPESYGGSADDAFHVVCPSVPGYGWSDPAREPGFDVKRVAEVVAKLMAKLGYARYGAQGGDWGAIVTTLLGRIDAEHLCGIHLNMVVAGPPPGVENPAEGLSPDELEATSRSREPSPRRSGTDSTIRRPGSRRGSSRSSAAGATAVATSSVASARTSCSRTS